ncbi:MAG: PRC-barrel domain-containing protein [[Eubacterium] siraeum]
MMCHFSDIRCKEVISIKSGCRIGFVDDVEIDSCSAKICRIIVYGKAVASAFSAGRKIYSSTGRILR